MSLLFRYMMKRWFLLFVPSMLVLISAYIAGDMAITVWNLLREGLSLPQLTLHFILKLPTAFYFLAPMASLLASLLMLTGFKKTGELGAIFYCGSGRFRILVPILAATLAVSLFSLYVNDQIAPAANKVSRDIVRDNSGTTTHLVGTSRIWLLEGSRVIYIRNVENGGTMLIEPTVLKFSDHTLKEMVSRIDAPEAVWTDGRWLMKKGILRNFKDNELQAVEGPGVISPDIRVTPKEFSIVKRSPEEMTMSELKKYVNNLKKSGFRYRWYEVRIFRKSATAFISFVFGLLALPVGFMVPVRGGVPLGIGLSIMITLAFWSIFTFFLSMGYSGLLPAPVSAWTVNILFLLLGAAALIGCRRPRLI